ncbi:AGAP010941-PA-like protein [Anopheles sinensis]|uniref:AGAP010941-PA-like protein n=1 Tax=Anopheles sinensis TaxID=74873 RepID=A0A084WQB0_ANOSI|nr:AGAP010941-PA-like protein [Anopheles sinensis]
MEFTPKETVLKLLKSYAVGRRTPDDEFFREGNFYLKPFVQLGVLSEIPVVESDPEDVEILCNVPDCNFICQSVLDYESHYNAQHRYTCGECKKTLPNAHLLDLHLSETHDSYFAAQVQAGKQLMYACFLEECNHLSIDPAARKDHCIREHKFPHNFRFDKKSNLHQRLLKQQVSGSPESNETAMDTTPTSVDPKEVPVPKCRKNFSFGHSKQRTFKPTKSTVKKCEILESNQMVVDLLESLPKE